MQLRINQTRIINRLNELAKIGATNKNGVSRLALTDKDKQARDLIIFWMEELDMNVHIDQIGNIIAIRQGLEDSPPVMTGSHIDTVSVGGRYDGCYGVLAGLEVVKILNEHNIQTRRPLAVTVFTNEEGVRFAPDMMGSLVYVGGLSIKDALATKGFDGSILGEELYRIGYAGKLACGEITPFAFIEAHVEQGPVLEQEQKMIGAVSNLLGISWQEITVVGESNHAGTTPLEFRHDAGLVAAKVINFVRELCKSIGNNQRGTCGMIKFEPNLINVIPAKATFTVDLRNSDKENLKKAEKDLSTFINEIAADEGVTINTRQLVQLSPVQFNKSIVDLIIKNAEQFNYSHRNITSGAGHDAQMMSRICPTSMIFIPSKGGISHNPKEYTSAKQMEAGANVLLHSLIALANDTN